MLDEKRRVLVVDDDPEIRFLLRSVLDSHSLAVDEASDGQEGAAMAEAGRYSVILLDLVMPNGGGAEVLRKLDSLNPTSGAVVLVITGAQQRIIDSLDARRVHGIITKPFDAQELASLVRACADIRSSKSMGAMCAATVLAGSPLLALLSSRW